MKLRNVHLGSFFGSIKRTGVAILVAATLSIVASAATAQDDISDFVVFGKNAVTYQGFTDSLGAPVGTNGDLNHLAGIGNFTALFGGGILNGANTNARQRVNDVTAATDDLRVVFNGGIRINELSRVNGMVQTQGDLTLGAGAAGDGITAGVAVGGAVTVGAFNEVFVIGANGDVFLGPSVHVLGSVGSGGNVTLDTAAKVDFGVVYGGTLTLAPLATVGQSTRGSFTSRPHTYVPVSIPQTPTPPVSAAPPIVVPLFGQQTLAPGHYSDLILQGSNDVFLSAGDYYFNNINMTGTFADLNLNVTGGAIRIFVNDDVAFDRLSTFVNGVPQATANSALAGNVALEAHGDVVLSGEFFGGVFAPKGDVTLRTLTNVVGAVVAGDEVFAEGAANVAYVRNAYLSAIPEPSTLVLGLLGVLAICMTRRRSRRIMR